MGFLEQRSGPDAHNTWFVDLFVRCLNDRAIQMYEKMGYSVFRRVVGCVPLAQKVPLSANSALPLHRYYNGMEGVGNSPDQLDGFGKSDVKVEKRRESHFIFAYRYAQIYGSRYCKCPIAFHALLDGR